MSVTKQLIYSFDFNSWTFVSWDNIFVLFVLFFLCSLKLNNAEQVVMTKEHRTPKMSANNS